MAPLFYILSNRTKTKSARSAIRQIVFSVCFLHHLLNYLGNIMGIDCSWKFVGGAALLSILTTVNCIVSQFANMQMRLKFSNDLSGCRARQPLSKLEQSVRCSFTHPRAKSVQLRPWKIHRLQHFWMRNLKFPRAWLVARFVAFDGKCMCATNPTKHTSVQVTVWSRISRGNYFLIITQKNYVTWYHKYSASG